MQKIYITKGIRSTEYVDEVYRFDSHDSNNHGSLRTGRSVKNYKVPVASK